MISDMILGMSHTSHHQVAFEAYDECLLKIIDD